MTPAAPRRNAEEVASLGREVYERQVRPKLPPEAHGKFIALDIITGEYELDDDDYTAVMRLHGRIQGAEVLLLRVGYPAAHKMGLR